MSAPPSTTLGQRLKRARKRANVRSQKRLAALMDVDVKSVSRWETDETPPSRANIRKLADLLGCDALWLERGIGTPEGQQHGLPEVEAYLLTPRGQTASASVVDVLRSWPFAKMRTPHPTPAEIEHARSWVEMHLAGRQNREDGDDSN